MSTKFKIIIVSLLFFIFIIFATTPILKLQRNSIIYYLQNNGYTCTEQNEREDYREWIFPGYGCSKEVHLSKANTDSDFIETLMLSVNFLDGDFPVFSLHILDKNPNTPLISAYAEYAYADNNQSILDCRNLNTNPPIKNCYDLKEYIQNNSIQIEEEITFLYDTMLNFYPGYDITNDMLLQTQNLYSD